MIAEQWVDLLGERIEHRVDLKSEEFAEHLFYRSRKIVENEVDLSRTITEQWVDLLGERIEHRVDLNLEELAKHLFYRSGKIAEHRISLLVDFAEYTVVVQWQLSEYWVDMTKVPVCHVIDGFVTGEQAFTRIVELITQLSWLADLVCQLITQCRNASISFDINAYYEEMKDS